MPFTDEGNWYHDRRLDHGDSWKMAAEKLAYDIETYLYAEKAEGYLKPEFLGWALARYDATKNSTGNVVGTDHWDPDDEGMYKADVPVGKRFPSIALKMSDDFKDSGLKGSGPVKDEPVKTLPAKDEPPLVPAPVKDEPVKAVLDPKDKS
jgi:hypothetical protein